MANTQPSETVEKQEKLKVEATLEPLNKSGNSEVVEGEGLKHLSQSTTPIATTKRPSKKTSTVLDYPSLRLQASLLAGALAEWLVVEKKKRPGTRAKSETVILTQPNGRKYKAIRIFLAIDENDLEVVESKDGLDFVVNGERLKVVDENKA